jgi:glycosyltransferase involved in cell wall biosynthesis
MAKKEISTTPQKNGYRVVALIPAFNEDRFIGSVILKTFDYVDQVVVVDDGSLDKTVGVAEAAGAMVIQHGINLGKGHALNTGLAKVKEMDPDAVVVLDADGQHDPSEIPGLVLKVLGCDSSESANQKYLGHSSSHEEDHENSLIDSFPRADIVIGSRYLENVSEVPKHRILGHWVFNKLTRFASGVNATDSQSGFRAFSPRALEVLSFSSGGFSVESEMQMLAHEHGLLVVDTPITVVYREKPKRNVFHHGMQVLTGVLRLIGQYRPLLFFGVPGVILLLLGLSWGGYVVEIFRRLQVLAVGYTMLSLLLSISGLVILSTGIILHSVRGLLVDILRDKKLF